MEEGVDHQVAVTLGEADDVAPRQERPADGFVTEHGTLGCAGGAGGEHDVAQIVSDHRCRSFGPDGVVDVAAGSHEVVPGGTAVRYRTAKHYDLFQLVGSVPDIGEHGHVVGVEEVGDREQCAG